MLSLILQPCGSAAAASQTRTAASSASVTDEDDPGASRLGQDQYEAWTSPEASSAEESVLTNPSLSKNKGSSQTVSPYTSSTYTHADAFDGKNIYNGIDVSKYNTNIDWNKVKADGIDFAIIRAGYRGYGSAGTLTEDPYFKEHIEGALAAGIKVGVYFFTQAVNTDEAVEEAQYVLSLISGYDITMPVALDFEWPTSNGKPVGRMYEANLTQAEYTAICSTFCDTIAASGYTPMVYANSSDLKNTIDGAKLAEQYKIWLANYTTKTSYTNPYEFWQYSSNGIVDGITDSGGSQARVDCNFWYTDLDINSLTAPSTGSSAQAVSLSTGKIAAIDDQTYTGSAIRPSVKVTLAGSTLKQSTDYTVSYSDNTNAGTATVTVTGKGNYTGSLSTTFTIYPKKPSGLSAVPASKKIALSWSNKTGAAGYQIYRKDTYNGSYKKIKTISDGMVSAWTNSKLSKKHEYYYRIRSYAKTADNKTIYSKYTTLTTGTNPANKIAVTKTSVKLLKKPSASSKKTVTIPKGAALVYDGLTHLKNNKTYHHVHYVTTAKKYSGYLPAKTSFKYYDLGTTTATLNLRKTAGTSGKILIKLPKNTAIALISEKKVKGTIWYKTIYTGKKGKTYTGYVSSDYIQE